MHDLDEIEAQIRQQLEVENRVTARIRAASLREAMGSQSAWQLERDVAVFASRFGWAVEKTEDCFSFALPT